MNQNIDQELYKKAEFAVLRSNNVVVIPHYNPDGDAIGSALALQNLLSNMGKQVNTISPNAYPEFLDWMKGSKEIFNYQEDQVLADRLIEEADLLIMVDFSHKSRLSNMYEIAFNSKAIKINIDHHPKPEQLSDYLFSDTRVSSTAELVYDFIHNTNLSNYMDKDIASCLYVGIMTDTGNFSHNSSRPETFLAVAELLKFSIDKDFIYGKVYQAYTENRMKLLGYSLSEKMVVLPEYKTAYISLSKEELEKHNFQLGDTEGFVNIPFSIEGVVFSALFLEKDDHIKISLRSRGNFSANDFAKAIYTGGGHKNAAGATSKLTLNGSIEALKKELEFHKNELNKTYEEINAKY